MDVISVERRCTLGRKEMERGKTDREWAQEWQLRLG